MRDLDLLNDFRDTSQDVLKHYGSVGDHQNGRFRIGSPIDGADMVIIASIGRGWEHVSVSRKNRCPNWPEMAHVKQVFFKPDETVMQLHVPEEEHINLHNNCLHLWRPLETEIPKPPSIMVGPSS